MLKGQAPLQASPSSRLLLLWTLWNWVNVLGYFGKHISWIIAGASRMEYHARSLMMLRQALK